MRISDDVIAIFCSHIKFWFCSIQFVYVCLLVAFNKVLFTITGLFNTSMLA